MKNRTTLFYNNNIYYNNKGTYSVSPTSLYYNRSFSSFYMGHTYNINGRISYGMGGYIKTVESEARRLALCKSSPCAGSVEINGLVGDSYYECMGTSGSLRFSRGFEPGQGTGWFQMVNRTSENLLVKRTIYNYTYGYGYTRYSELPSCWSSSSSMPTSYLACIDWVPLVPGMLKKIESGCNLASLQYNIQFDPAVLEGAAPLLNAIKNGGRGLVLSSSNTGYNGGYDLIKNIENYGDIAIAAGVTQSYNAFAINVNIAGNDVINGTQQIIGLSATLPNISTGQKSVAGNFTTISGWASNGTPTANFVFTQNAD